MENVYGLPLQRYLLEHFEIIAIMESKVEAWFEESDVNTCITILRYLGPSTRFDCNKNKDHLVRFVTFKKKLDEKPFFPLNVPDDQRWYNVDKWRDFIESKTKPYEDENIKINVVPQAQLINEAFENYGRPDEVFRGVSFSIYLRAPRVYFEIMEKGRNKFVPLSEISEIKRGITSGANEFFYLRPASRKEIEKELAQRNWKPEFLKKHRLGVYITIFHYKRFQTLCLWSEDL